MTELREEFVKPPLKSGSSRYRLLVIAGVALGAILFQVYVPRLVPVLSYIELPLLVTVYFPLMRRSPLAGVVMGAAIGLAQDSLSSNPLGIFGIAKTLVGYSAGSISQRFDDSNNTVRLVLGFAFFILHQIIYVVLQRVLRSEPTTFNVARTLVEAALNALIAVPFFLLLDRLKTSD